LVEVYPWLKIQFACSTLAASLSHEIVKGLLIFWGKLVGMIAMFITNTAEEKFHADDFPICHFRALFTVEEECLGKVLILFHCAITHYGTFGVSGT
jgi:hypothetical protein